MNLNSFSPISLPHDFVQLCEGLANRNSLTCAWLRNCAEPVLKRLAEGLHERGALSAYEKATFVPHALIWVRQYFLNLKRRGQLLKETGSDLESAVRRLVAVAVARQFGRPDTEEFIGGEQRLREGSATFPTGYTIYWLDWPARKVSGDFWISGTVADRSWLLLGDVCGKGWLANCVSEAIRLLVPEFANVHASDPPKVLQTLSDELMRILPESLFVTALLTVCTHDGKSDVLSAGMSPVIFHNHSNRQADFVELSGIPLGLEPAAEEPAFGVRTLTFAPGDELLLLSDGVLDQETATGRFSTELPVLCRSLLPDESFFGRVRMELLGLLTDHDQFDDITLISVQRKLAMDTPVCRQCPEKVCPALVERILLADPTATAELTILLRREMEPSIRRMFSDPNDVDDVLQDAFIKLFTRFDDWNRQCPLCLFFRVIATHEALNVLRRRKRSKEQPFGSFEPKAIVARQSGNRVLVDNAADSWLDSIPFEIADCLRVKLESAAPRAKMILAARFRNLSRPEIAAELKITRQAVGAHLRKLEHWLSECFKE